jgi:hypothetical protein
MGWVTHRRTVRICNNRISIAACLSSDPLPEGFIGSRKAYNHDQKSKAQDTENVENKI